MARAKAPASVGAATALCKELSSARSAIRFSAALARAQHAARIGVAGTYSPASPICVADFFNARRRRAGSWCLFVAIVYVVIEPQNRDQVNRRLATARSSPYATGSQREPEPYRRCSATRTGAWRFAGPAMAEKGRRG